ncbi:uncharacterized protein LOC133531588 isoform X2 [Cydia pomonella]|uniref:uncharacterized protein LOC133531588 isoform X2 n=1 Tax=Cydia pomonella TaxID=82600 RepID=UPI002ADE1E2A|nr:uncharacterized protein LOC133531588 isoform X2 [Cydia pomonella]
MCGNWMCFVILDLVIVTYSSPDRLYHDYHTSHDKNPWSGDLSPGWQYDWFGQTTPRPTRRRTTTARIVTESIPTTTLLPPPVIRDIETRLGERQTTGSPTPSPRPITLIQDEIPSLLKEPKPQTLIESGANRDNFQSLGAVENSDIKLVKEEIAISNKDGEKPVFIPADNNPNSFGIAVVHDNSEAKVKQETSLPNNAKPQDSAEPVQIAPISTIDAADNTAKPVQADTNESNKPVTVQVDDDIYEHHIASIDAALAAVLGTDNGKDTTAPLLDEKASLWHVAIYKKKALTEQYSYICGGSLIKANMVISAGHCFWSPVWQALPRTLFRVAAGKLYPGYDDPRDTTAQYSEIRNISISDMDDPCKQPDLAFMNLVTPFKYTSTVKPVCFSQNWGLETRQLREGNTGTVASWAAPDNGGCLPRRHSWLALPFVKNDVCEYEGLYKTTGNNRICAGEINSTSPCAIDSGNGLVFYYDKIPYLRGVATDLPVHPECARFYTRSFATIMDRKSIIRKYLKGITDVYNLEECENLYKNPTTENNQKNETDNRFGDGFVQVAPPEEDGNTFTAQGIGSSPVPTLPGTSAPSFQWHVGIYSKRWAPYMQICGGSLVKRDFVISAAHCFWDDVGGQQPASQFAVAGGKLFRPWNNTQDTYAQHSDVSEIILPVRFRGGATSFQDDIAVIRMSTAFTYAPGVQSVCVNFDKEFDMKQLQPGNIGTILGWGLTKANGTPSQRLTYLELPYIDVDECFVESEPTFLKFITSDKICAGDTVTGKALCRGDSGGGFVLYSSEIPYLHGVASTAAGNENLCNAFTHAAFTSLYAHRAFLRDNIRDIDKECVKPETTTQPTQRVNVETVLGAVGAVGTTGTPPVYTNVPYFPYPNHFVCNCNCKP